MDKAPKGDELGSAEIHHLPRHDMLSDAEILKRDMELSIAAHFRDQNELLRKNNTALTDRIQRLTAGVEGLVQEMNGVRTGKKEEAFARVAGIGAPPDLPSVNAEAALIYIFTATQIGKALDFHCSQVGLLLGAKGLGWVGNGAYQEIGRIVSASQSKFWHREVPDRLKKILSENDPAKYNITNKAVLSIFKRWQARRQRAELLEQLEPSDAPH